MTPLERFEALPKNAQQSILDKYRNRHTEYHEWWDSVYEQFAEKMEELGIIIHTRTYNSARGRSYTENAIYFSGFGSQGNGACFNGEIGDFEKAFARHSTLLLEHIGKISYRTVSWTSTGSYSHSSSLAFSDQFEMVPTGYVGLRLIAQEQLEAELTDKWEQFVENVKQEIKGLCDELYENLEEEYDYLTSDECVLEGLRDNDELEEAMGEFEEAEHE